MTNILGDEKRQEVLALGRVGWTLRRIQKATGVRRETASAYLQAAGIAIRAPRMKSLPENGAETKTLSLDTSAGPRGNDAIQRLRSDRCR